MSLGHSKFNSSSISGVLFSMGNKSDKLVEKYLSQSVKGKDRTKVANSGLVKSESKKAGASQRKLTPLEKCYCRMFKEAKKYLKPLGYEFEEVEVEGGQVLPAIKDPMGKLPLIAGITSPWITSMLAPMKKVGSPFSRETEAVETGSSSFGQSAFGLITARLKEREYGPRRVNFKGFDFDSPLAIRDWVVNMVGDDFWKDIESMQKIGPCSGVNVGAYVKGVADYYTPPERYNPDRDILDEAFRKATDEIIHANGGVLVPDPLLPDGISIAELKGKSIEEFSDVVDAIRSEADSAFGKATLDSFKGFPYAKTKLSSVDEWVTYLEGAELIWSGEATVDVPSILGKRRQNSTVDAEGNVTKEKCRQTFMGTWSEFVAGRRFFSVVLKVMKSLSSYGGYNGVHTMGGIFENALKQCVDSNGKFFAVSLDPSGYDKGLFYLLDEDGLWDSMERMCPDAAPYFAWCRRYYTRCPLIGPGGVWYGQHGLFSGCLLTGFIGSFLNRVMALVTEMTLKVTIVQHTCMGDDTALIGIYEGERLQLKDFVEVYANYGLNVDDNVIKSGWFDDLTDDKTRMYIAFMGRYFRWNPNENDHCKPVFSLTRCCASILFPENISKAESVLHSMVSLAREAYGEGYTFNVVRKSDNNSLTGEVIRQFASTLMNIEHHPDKEVLIERLVNSEEYGFNVNTGWISYSDTDLEWIMRKGAHVDYDKVAKTGAISLEAVQAIVRYAWITSVETVYMEDLLEKDGVMEDETGDGALADLESISEGTIRGNIAQQLTNQLSR